MLGHLKAGDEQEIKQNHAKESEQEHHKKAIKALHQEAIKLMGFYKNVNVKKDVVEDFNPSAGVPGHTPLNRNW